MDARTAYREAAVRGASAIGLVVLLYEQAIQDLQRALNAIKDKNVERRTLEINHALQVIGHLHGTLNMERGGEVAKRLAQFYELFQSSMRVAQARVSAEIIRKQIGYLLEIREAWVEVEQALSEKKSAGVAASETLRIQM